MTMCFKASWFSALFSNDTCTIHFLPFMDIPLIITVSSLNDEQYGCSSFYTSAFVDCQPYNVYSDNKPKCSLSAVANLIGLL